jgi:hypothetical protein
VENDMNITRKLSLGILSICAMFLPGLVRAHPGPSHVHGWQGDWSYLFNEFDYLYAMIAAGIAVFLIAIWRLRSDA